MNPARTPLSAGSIPKPTVLGQSGSTGPGPKAQRGSTNNPNTLDKPILHSKNRAMDQHLKTMTGRA